ncbi:hypothetical protein [Natronobacterium texcoconense]|uniref:RCK C-terminal domain-containing protein n=1 Tax=Natronobacterium texcoconense TaxID=1095778 RepID=A0A1H0YUY0_NATTX|nr:hypothetical protein [Natronobacterium texcoconense]SDQ19002.1 hypothetical protein SAMN04489842_0017 [Natronobacterium texcoconense]
MSDVAVVILTATIVTEWTEVALVNVFGFAVLATVASMVVSFAYRRYSTRPVPPGVTALVGLAVVGGWLNVAGIGRSTIIDETSLFHHATAVYFLGAFLTGVVGAEGGRHVGDHLAREVYGIDSVAAPGTAASIVRAGRRSIELDLPETITDADGYPPVEESVKRTLAGKPMLFPARLSVDDLESRLVDRLERDYGIGCATADLAPDGTVERLAIGRRRSGLHRTLPPDTAAVAIRSDPPADASVGDPIEVWDDSSHLVATGMLRATAGDVVTIVVDENDAGAFDCGPGTRYRLVIRPESPTAVPAFVAALRSADETIVSASVRPESELVNEFVGWIPGTVLALVRDDGDEVLPFPDDEETLVAGDDLYVLGPPTAVQNLQSAG